MSSSSVMITELLDIAKFHNCRGIELYQKGLIKEAKKVFIQVLHRLSELDEDDECGSVPICTTFGKISRLDGHSSSSCQIFERCRLELSDNGDNVSLFSGAMRMANDIGVRLHAVTAVAIYNLALVHNLEGLLCRTMSTKSSLMLKALKLYDQAWFLAETCFQGSVGLTIMMAAVRNNMATIHECYFNNIRMSTDLIKDLADIIIVIEGDREFCNKNNTIDGSNQMSTNFPADDVQFFAENIFFAQMKSHQAAPAA